MKILHFIPSLIRGGAERVVIDLANDATRRGHQVTIVAAVCHSPELLPTPVRSDVKLRYVHPQGGVRAAQARLLPWTIANRKWLFTHDVIHCHLWLGTEFGALLQRIPGRRGKPAIVETYHAVGTPILKRHRALHALLLNGRDAVAFVAEDPYWERYRSARPSRLFRTIANGVSTPERGDCGVRAGDRQKAGIPSDALVVGSIGRLVGERRPDVLMDAFVGIARRTHQTHLLLGGDGPERSVLEARARELGLGPRVHLPGLVLNIAEQLSIMDLYLTIAVGPMVGIAALEAALFGLPVLAAQLLPEYHASDEDWVWSSSDPEEVAVRAIELLSNRGALRELAKRQQDHCRAHHSAEVMGQAYDRLYSDALALRGE